MDTRVEDLSEFDPLAIAIKHMAEMSIGTVKGNMIADVRAMREDMRDLLAMSIAQSLAKLAARKQGR